MNYQSDSIKELATALSQAQKDKMEFVKVPKKDAIEVAQLEMLSAYKAYLKKEAPRVAYEHIDNYTRALFSVEGDEQITTKELIDDSDPKTKTTLKLAYTFVMGFGQGYQLAKEEDSNELSK